MPPTVLKIPLLAQVTCPHCWETFPPERVLWISQHPELRGDIRLGPDQPIRFLPTRFNVAGAALDAKDFPCRELACPRCHLSLPRPMLEVPPCFLSILGAPACGKSYFMASMIWQLRQNLPRYFGLTLADADAMMNHRLQEYESQQFLNPDPNALVLIEKTETHGDPYDTVLYGDQSINYLRPFVFTITPTAEHPQAASPGGVARALCMYDNSGESFRPGEDRATSPVTRHLALSEALFFLFDPTQDPRFRRACRGLSSDPQLSPDSAGQSWERQEIILHEAAARVRRYAGLAQNSRHARPLVVVVTKCDCWSGLLPQPELQRPWTANGRPASAGLLVADVEAVSHATRELLQRLSPEIVAAAEGFAHHVLYVPVSATGCSPEVNPQTGARGFRASSIKPIWVEVPLLYVMSRWMRGLVTCAQGHGPRPPNTNAGLAAGTAPTAGTGTTPDDVDTPTIMRPPAPRRQSPGTPLR